FFLSAWGTGFAHASPVRYQAVLERAADSPIHVGDALVFKIPEPPAEARQVALGEGVAEDKLVESGWSLVAADSGQIVMVPLQAGSLSFPAFEIKNENGEVIGIVDSQPIQVTSVLKPEDLEKR